MARAAFGWMNQVTLGSITASSEQAGLGVGNLQTEQGSTAAAWQTANGVTSAYLQIDSGSSATVWRAGGLFRTNLTTAATVRWRVGNDPTFAANIFDSGVVPTGMVAGYQQSVLFLTVDVTCRYARCDIADPTNPDNHLNIPLAFAGSIWQPSVNASWKTSAGRDRAVDETITRGGQEFPNFRFARRRWDVTLEGLKSTEAWPQVMEMDRLMATGGNMLFVPDYEGDAARQSVFGRLTPLADIGFTVASAEAQNYRARITERL